MKQVTEPLVNLTFGCRSISESEILLSVRSWDFRTFYSCCHALNKLDSSANEIYGIYEGLRALSSVLTMLGLLQPRALQHSNRYVCIPKLAHFGN